MTFSGPSIYIQNHGAIHIAVNLRTGNAHITSAACLHIVVIGTNDHVLSVARQGNRAVGLRQISRIQHGALTDGFGYACFGRHFCRNLVMQFDIAFLRVFVIGQGLVVIHYLRLPQYRG